MKGFQVGVMIFFGFFVLLAVLIFSGAIDLSKKNSSGGTASAPSTLKMWGTVPKKNLSKVIEFINTQSPGVGLSYTEKDPRNYEKDLLEAFAFGGAPDMFLVSPDLIYKYEDKLLTIPYTYFPEKTFNDTYIRAVDIFKKKDGFLGFPIFSDPLVMYFNQDLLETAGYTKPPEFWSDMSEYIPKLTRKDEALRITTAGVALGEFENIKNAKEIFVSMMLQLNNSVVAKDTKGEYVPILDQASNVSARPAIQTLNFISEFSNPLSKSYSWNKGQKNSESLFISGDLVLYFGLSSEFRNLRLKNPNLNFSVASIPQVKELKNSVTYAHVYALGISKTSPNAGLALSMSANLANGTNTGAIVAGAGFAPVRRDLVSGTKPTPESNVIYASALNSRSWVDPNAEATDSIFGQMIEDITSGLSTPEKAVKDANLKIKTLLF